MVATETGSIIHNLLAANPKAGIETTPSNDSYFWSLFSEGTIMLHLQPSRVLSMMDAAMDRRLSPEQAKGAHALYKLFDDNWASPNIQTQLDVVEEFLAKHQNFSGNDQIGEGDVSPARESTVDADAQFMMSYPLNVLTYGLRAGDFKVGPATRKWLDGMRARPAWKRALEKMDNAEKNQSTPARL